MTTRLNKYLAMCGLGSRRAVEDLITSGRITVNGKKIINLGTVVGEGDKVQLDGSPVSHSGRCYYVLLNKPRGYITTVDDDQKRPTVMDLIPEKYKRRGVFPVGRLDLDTSGLLLFTNDGDLAYRLTRPDFHVPKEYIVEINRPLDDTDRVKLSRGVYIRELELKTRPAQVDTIDESGRHIRIIITEGKNRQIRHMFMSLGYKVKALERTVYGTLTARRLKKGSFRELNDSELHALKKMAGLSGH
jgi:23S rRNA pseudouridine2605 synthase